MSFSFTGHYHIRFRRIFSATVILAGVFICARIATSDVLMLGYTMAVPVFVFLSVVFEDARTDKRSLRGLQAWIETSIAAVSAAAVGYLGYCLWLLGF